MADMAAGLAAGIGCGLAIGIGSGRAMGKGDGEKQALAQVERNIRDFAQAKHVKILVDDKEITTDEFIATVVAPKTS